MGSFAVTSQQVLDEAECNLANKLPQALPAFRLIATRCLRVVSDPLPDEVRPCTGLADPKDLPILVAAWRWLTYPISRP